MTSRLASLARAVLLTTAAVVTLTQTSEADALDYTDYGDGLAVESEQTDTGRVLHLINGSPVPLTVTLRVDHTSGGCDVAVALTTDDQMLGRVSVCESGPVTVTETLAPGATVTVHADAEATAGEPDARWSYVLDAGPADT